jgi:mono/diheme cytochrome c family protein
MRHPRILVLALIIFLGMGCGDSSLPEFLDEPPSVASAGRYAPRNDFLIVGKTGLDGAPRAWPSSGFPPMTSARMPNATPDRELAEDIRKQLGRTVLDPATRLEPAQAELIGKLLDRHFGTPAEPRVHIPGWDVIKVDALFRTDSAKLFKNLKAAATELKRWKVAPVKADWDSANAARERLKLDDETLARGSVLYRRWCMQCHGPTGAGDGAHAIQLAAMPRDYRQGLFKFTTSFQVPGEAKQGTGTKNLLRPAGKPLRDDLKRVIRRGIDGSMMPAFPTLTDAEVEDLVSYVIHLSVRGETEFATISKVMNPTEDDPPFDSAMPVRWLFDQNLMWVLLNWSLAQDNAIPIPPENTPNAEARLVSAARGAQRFTEFGCAGCHTNYGREQQLKWDLWGGVVQPRNLVLGVYRGGRRGEDLYARIYGGIYPSGMPAHYDRLAGGTSDPDQPDRIWDIVHFLQALSDPADRIRVRDRVRKKDATFNIEP